MISFNSTFANILFPTEHAGVVYTPHTQTLFFTLALLSFVWFLLLPFNWSVWQFFNSLLTFCRLSTRTWAARQTATLLPLFTCLRLCLPTLLPFCSDLFAVVWCWWLGSRSKSRSRRGKGIGCGGGVVCYFESRECSRSSISNGFEAKKMC